LTCFFDAWNSRLFQQMNVWGLTEVPP